MDPGTPEKKSFSDKKLSREFRFIEYPRVSLLVMTFSCKTWLLFVAAAFKIKNLLFTFFILFSPYVWTQGFFNEIHFLIPHITLSQ